MESKLEQLKNIHDISGDDGNWNYSPYMLGLYNGIEFSMAILEDRDPVFKSKPEIWLKEKDLKPMT